MLNVQRTFIFIDVYFTIYHVQSKYSSWYVPIVRYIYVGYLKFLEFGLFGKYRAESDKRRSF